MSAAHIPPIIAATKTAVFQLRAPSAWKRAALLDAMKRTHLATRSVLAALLAKVEEMRALAKKTERTDHMQKLAYAALDGWDLSGASAAAARVDAIGMVESYLASLKDGRATASMPTVPALGREAEKEHAARYAAALDELALGGHDIETESDLRDKISALARPIGLRPLSLHGYGHFYCLLRHPETGRLFAWINILSRKSRLAPSQREANARAAAFDGEMIDVATEEAVRCKKPTWLLFPLAFGSDFHDRDFLLAGKPAGGRLVYRPDHDRFELHAGFTFEAPAIDTAGRFLGIDLGIYNLAAWAVTDGDGRLFDDGAISGMGLRHVQRQHERRRQEAQRRGRIVRGRAKRAQADEAVHWTANELVRLAKEHAARVVVEALTMKRRTKPLPKGKKGGRWGRAARRILGRQQYAKLVQVLTYKLAVTGLPPPIEVGEAYTSRTCPECGYEDVANRPKVKAPGSDVIDMSAFRCVRCGHEADADRNAARVIAVKGAWLVQLPTLKERGGKPLQESEKFEQYLLDAIRRRGSGGEKLPVPS